MDATELQEIGNRISERRKQLNYTQEQIAEKMGVSIQMISNLERGNKAIQIGNLIKICGLLEVSTDYILLGNRTQKDAENTASKLSQLSDADYKKIELLVEYCLHEENG